MFSGSRIRLARVIAGMLVGIAVAVALAAPSEAMPNNEGGGGRSMSDILHDGYRCIAQDPRSGMIWCVRGQGEPGYVCTPDGWCTPVPPSPTPPWGAIRKPGGAITRLPGTMAPLRN